MLHPNDPAVRTAYNDADSLAEFGEWVAMRLFGDIPARLPAATQPTPLDAHSADDAREAIRRADAAFWRILATELNLPSGDFAPGEMDPFYDAMIPAAARFVANNAAAFTADEHRDAPIGTRGELAADIIGDGTWW